MMITDHKSAVQLSLRVLEIVTLKRVSECQVLAPPPLFCPLSKHLEGQTEHRLQQEALKEQLQDNHLKTKQSRRVENTMIHLLAGWS